MSEVQVQQKIVVPERPPMHPESEKKELTSRERAELRTKELLEHGDISDEAADEFYVNLSEIPEGYDYQWKRRSTYGVEDPAYDVQVARQGWQSVPLSRHPAMMPRNHKGTEITRSGLVLMERPKQITDMLRQAEDRKARLQVRIKEEQLTQAPSGQFERNFKGESLVKVKHGFEKMPVIDD